MTTALAPRSAEYRRSSAETTIELELTLDGSGKTSIETGFGMLDHMLTLMAFWADMDLRLVCKGDLHVDAHHTAEDIGLCLGAALLEALGDRAGIARVGYGRVPMDEALADVTVDLSGRPWLEWRGDDLLPPGNAHICFHYGKNGHHLLESAAKGMGLALAQAVCRRGSAIRSTKGGLD